jgi:hypothetical protein
MTTILCGRTCAVIDPEATEDDAGRALLLPRARVRRHHGLHARQGAVDGGDEVRHRDHQGTPFAGEVVAEDGLLRSVER